jgi:hypothetical protein
VKDLKRFSIFATKFAVNRDVDVKKAWHCGLHFHNFVARVSELNQTGTVFARPLEYDV